MWPKFLQRMMSHSKKMPDSFLRFTSENEIDASLSAMRTGECVLVFKHSTRCPVSFGALSEMQSVLAELPEGCSVYLIDVISERPFSQYVAQKTDIIHQSPQLLYFDEGEFESLSHYSITKERVMNIVQAMKV